MPRIFRPNAYFEEEILEERLSPRKLHSRNSIIESAMLVLAGLQEEADTILVHNLPDPEWTRYLEEKGFRIGAYLKWNQTHGLAQGFQENPRFGEWGNVSRWVNGKGPILNPNALALSKRLSSKIRQSEWKQTSGFCEFESFPIREISEWIACRSALDPRDRFVLKPEFGFAGASLLGTPEELEETVREFFRERNENLVLEPWKNRTSDFSLLFRSENGKSETEGGTILLSDPEGRYSGTWIGKSEEIDYYLSLMQGVSEKISSFCEDYSGFGSIDSFFFRSGESLLLRKISEINFRWTMGRILWELRKHSPQEEYSDLLLFLPQISVSDAYLRIPEWEKTCDSKILPLSPFYTKNGKPRPKNLVWIRIPKPIDQDPWKVSKSVWEEGIRLLRG